MFLTLGLIFAIIWLMAMAGLFTMGGYVHYVGIAAVILVILHIVVGRGSRQPPTRIGG